MVTDNFTPFSYQVYIQLMDFTDKFVFILFLDVKAAFSSTIIAHLFHNMHLKGMSKEYTG